MIMPSVLDQPHALVDERGDDLPEVTVFDSFYGAWKVYCGMLREEGHENITDDASSLTNQNAWDIYIEDMERDIVPVQYGEYKE